MSFRGLELCLFILVLESCSPAVSIKLLFPITKSAPAAARPVIQSRHSDGIKSMAFSPDGQLLATAGNDGTVRIWEVASCTLLRVFTFASHWVPDFVTWTRPRTVAVRVWPLGLFELDVQDPKRAAQQLSVGMAPPLALAHAPLAKQRAWIIQLDSGTLRGFGPDVLHLEPELKLPAELQQGPIEIHLSPDGQALLVGNWDGELWLEVHPLGKSDWRRLPGKYRQVNVVSATEAVAIAFADGQRDDLVRLRLDVSPSAIQRLPLPDRNPAPVRLAASADGRSLAGAYYHTLGSADDRLVTWDLASSRFTVDPGARLYADWYRKEDFQNPSVLAMSPQGQWLAAGTYAGYLGLYNLQTRRFWGQLGHGKRAPKEVLFLSETKLLVTSEGHLAVWSLSAAAMNSFMPLQGVVGTFSNREGMFWTVRRGDKQKCQEGAASFLREYSSGTVLAQSDGVASGRGVLGLRSLPGLGMRSAAPAPPATLPGLGKSQDILCIPQNQNPDGAEPRALAQGVLFSAKESAAAPHFLIRPLEAEKPIHLELAQGWVADRPIALSSDGSRALGLLRRPDTVGARIMRWNAQTGAALPLDRLTQEHLSEWFQAAALSEDGQEIAVANSKKLVATLWPGRAIAVPVELSALAVRGRQVVAGAIDGSLLVIDDAGVRHSAGLSGKIAGVWLSPKLTRAVTVSDDGTLVVWSLQAGGPTALAAMTAFDDDEWLIVTREGRFSGSAAAASRIGWEIASSRSGAIYGVQQYSELYDPEYVQRRLSDDATLVPAPAPAGPPALRLLSSARDPAGRTVTLHVRVDFPRHRGKVHAWVEGQPVVAQSVRAPSAELTLRMPLIHPGSNRVTVIAVGDDGIASLPLALDIRGPPQPQKRPELWVVAIGINRYPGLSAFQQLQRTEDDVRDLVATAAAHAGPGKTYAKLHATTVLNEQASLAAMKRALSRLTLMGRGDVAIVLLSGHGVRPRGDTGEMVFASYNVDLSDAASAVKTSLGWQQISQRLSHARGRVLVLLDACHAGSVTSDLFVSSDDLLRAMSRSRHSGAVVFAAAKGRQPSREGIWHGVFTDAFLKTLYSRDTDRNRDGWLQLSEIVEETIARVATASQGAQLPLVAHRELVGDFALLPAPAVSGTPSPAAGATAPAPSALPSP